MEKPMSLAIQAKLGLEIAIKRKKAIGLVVDGVLFMFKSVTKIEERDTGTRSAGWACGEETRSLDHNFSPPQRVNVQDKYITVWGHLEGDTFKTLHPELHHWVQFDLQKVSAVIDRDHAGAVLDDK
jgi:hypothetical protein